MTGAVVYQGPSQLDGAPIVAIATFESDNAKTGNMAQIWIMRSDMSPVEASNRGLDSSVCGDCIHRGVRNATFDAWESARTCYVTLVQAPGAVYRTFVAGKYPVLTPTECSLYLAGRAVRLGAWGDPAAVPVKVWRALLRYAVKHTGYTHQWRHTPNLRGLVMASCDSERDQLEAQAAGWRTFRVRSHGDRTMPREIVCPASHERPLTSCERCGLCNGSTGSTDRRANIVIDVHGSGVKTFVALSSLRRIAS